MLKTTTFTLKDGVTKLQWATWDAMRKWFTTRNIVYKAEHSNCSEIRRQSHNAMFSVTVIAISLMWRCDGKTHTDSLSSCVWNHSFYCSLLYSQHVPAFWVCSSCRAFWNVPSRTRNISFTVCIQNVVHVIVVQRNTCGGSCQDHLIIKAHHNNSTKCPIFKILTS